MARYLDCSQAAACNLQANLSFGTSCWAASCWWSDHHSTHHELVEFIHLALPKDLKPTSIRMDWLLISRSDMDETLKVIGWSESCAAHSIRSNPDAKV